MLVDLVFPRLTRPNISVMPDLDEILAL